MEVRKRMGIRVILFLSVMTIFFDIAKTHLAQSRPLELGARSSLF